MHGNEMKEKKPKKWTDGTFCSSRNGWAGAGAYFGSARSTAKGYAYDGWRLSDNNPVMIVCRASLSKIMNYGPAPHHKRRIPPLAVLRDGNGRYSKESPFHRVIDFCRVSSKLVCLLWMALSLERVFMVLFPLIISSNV